MEEIKHVLNKAELEKVGNILSIAKIQEELLNAMSLAYREFLIGTILKRLGLKADMVSRCVVDLPTGILIIRNEEKPTQNSTAPVEVKK